MDAEDNDRSPKSIPLDGLKSHSAADDLLSSPAMEPYVKLALAMMSGRDVTPAIEEIAALPLEKRYTWRVASAIKWAFADFENLNVEADRKTLSTDDQSRIMELLKHRPLQFCLFLSSLVGQKEMETLMVSAIKNSRVIAAAGEDP